jgi:DNA-binding MarR family transcriptional regulator
MGKSSFLIDTDELITFMAALMRFRRHVIDTMPEHIARFKKRLDKMKIHDDRKHNDIDHDLFYRISLAILSRHQGPMPMGELSKALDVALSTATRMVDELVNGGLAERVADPDDRRVVRVTLTKEGEELYQITTDYMRTCIGQVFNNFTDEERTELVRLLRKAADRMNDIMR